MSRVGKCTSCVVAVYVVCRTFLCSMYCVFVLCRVALSRMSRFVCRMSYSTAKWMSDVVFHRSERMSDVVFHSRSEPRPGCRAEAARSPRTPQAPPVPGSIMDDGAQVHALEW